MAIGNWAKRKAKQATKAVGKRYGVSYGRRGVRASKNSFSKLAKDVMMIKASLNTEKKYIDTLETAGGFDVGQVRDNLDGASAFDITPQIPQGTGESQRVGNSIKATGLVLKFSMIKQAQAEGDRRLRIYVVKSLDPGMSSFDIHNRILDINPFVPVRDYNSNLDYTQFKDKRLKIISTKNVYFPQNGGDALGSPEDTITRSLTMPIKLNDVLRYETNADPTPENVRYHVIVVADNGNSGSVASLVLGTYVQTPQSGVNFRSHCRMWYVDN